MSYSLCALIVYAARKILTLTGYAVVVCAPVKRASRITLLPLLFMPFFNELKSKTLSYALVLEVDDMDDKAVEGEETLKEEPGDKMERDSMDVSMVPLLVLS